jgi:Zn-dependent peptidase ImmA (M78 family)/transcriptional regulator with XRE-family HTH domain
VNEIGPRVAACLRERRPTQTQREFAAALGMAPDALSRALSGERKFSAAELAEIADLLGADVHWLITGEPDPYRIVLAARHDYDHATGARSVPDRDTDARVLEDVALVYRQAYGADHGETTRLPGDVEATRTTLGDDYVRPFADRLESRLGVDVVRLAEISTAWSFTLAGRGVVVLPATGNWFRENWSLAHELAHLSLGHHARADGESVGSDTEMAANAFAAELLLPAGTLRGIDWSTLSAAALAALVWGWGVSTDALRRRLDSLRIQVPDTVAGWAAQPTQQLLWRHWGGSREEITRRMDDAATRRFPVALQARHLEQIEAGKLGKATLAWMLGVHEHDLELDEPAVSGDVSTDELLDTLGR